MNPRPTDYKSVALPAELRQPNTAPETSRASSSLAKIGVERETGLEPATNGLEGRDSTLELLPPLSLTGHYQF